MTTTTTTTGKQIEIHNVWINGNRRVAIEAASPKTGQVHTLELHGTLFRFWDGRPAFAVSENEAARLTEIGRAETVRLSAERRARWAAKDEAEWAGRMTRAQYEEICEKNGWTARPDAELSFNELSYMSDEERTHHRRYLAYEMECKRAGRMTEAQAREQAHAEYQVSRARPLSETVGRVQLWEPCERCGREPSYATPRGHLCEACQKCL